MRRILPLGLLALCLAGCDAGHRNDPGVDNRSPGPHLVIVAPAAEQVLPSVGTAPVLDEQGQPTGSERRLYAWPTALFDVRHLATADQKAGARVWFSLDGGPAQEVSDVLRPVDLGARLPKPAGSGSHVLQAWVTRADGTPFSNPQAAAVRHFHLGQADGAFDVRQEGEDPRAPFVERDPHLLIVAPTDDGAAARLLVAATGTQWGSQHRMRIDVAGRTAYSTSAGEVQLRALEGLADLPTGDTEVTISLERRTRDGWEFVPGPFNRETRRVLLP